MLSMPFVMVNLELLKSLPAREYSGFWPARKEFCALMLPIVRLPFRMPLLSRTMYQGPRFWLKSLACWNMLRMLVAEETFQEDMSPLNLEAPENIPVMSVTEETFQFDRLPLNLDAPENMYAMLVTSETSHVEMSSVKERAS